MATTWFLMLLTLGLGLATTSLVPTSKPITTKRGCYIHRFRSLPPRELEAFKKAKDALEERLMRNRWNCNTSLFPKDWNLRLLQVWERPVALEAELTLVLKVLENLTESPLGPVLDQPLSTLSQIHSQLQACLPAQPKAGIRPRGRLHHWLHRLQEAPKKETADCILASVTFHLFHLLLQDLKCVASGDQCVLRPRP
ncbi:interferon lambda-1-like [Erinaceus europaeus]|uniref:Interferon lambda-1-like n=1 Tax=Erinaceus europaeus TaxID=9365 RepID=A0A1S2ZSZ0_ERIEU|nr:interferon lambda-1-like [Erinaceus europaeus]